MLTLDEAIIRAEERINLLEESAAGCDMNDRTEKEIAVRSGKCAAEHKQLAEWLRELKHRREHEGLCIYAEDYSGDCYECNRYYSDMGRCEDVEFDYNRDGTVNIAICKRYKWELKPEEAEE